ncbi:hypothetical protein ACJ72_05531, partial [Emergomyces africanus]
MALAVEEKVQKFAVNNSLDRGCSSSTPNEKAPCRLNIGVSGRQTPTERQKYQLWPNLKRPVMASGRRTPDLSDLKSKPFKEGGTLYRRRKISVPELGPLTTVQEKNIDSPTIPGKFPAHERSNSAPGASWGRTTCEGSALEPVREPLNSSRESFRKVLGSFPMEDDGHKSIKRASSVLLPHALPAYYFVANVVETSKVNLPVRSLESNNHPEKGDPPEVPPKSPRLGLRIPTTQPMESYFSATSNSCATTFAPPTSSTAADNCSEQSFIFPLHSKNAEAQPSFDSRLPATTYTSPFPLKGRGTSSHSKNRSVGVCQPYQNAITLPPLQHKKGSMSLDNNPDFRQDSVAEKTPTRNKSSSAVDAIEPKPNKESLGYSCLILPAGIPAHTAPKLLSRDETERLKIQAWEQAKQFEVLKHSEVRSLSR